MSLLFDLEALASEGGISFLQAGQRDFSPYVIHFTSYKSMEPIRHILGDLRKGSNRISTLPSVLKMADQESAFVLRKILYSRQVMTAKFHSNYPEAVCLTECTLPGVLAHASRYGRYGLVFRKDYIASLGGQPLAYVPSNSPGRYTWDIENGQLVRKNALHMTILRQVSQSGWPTQDFTHEREWRCGSSLSVQEAEALIVARSEDCQAFAAAFPDRPIIPLDLMYRLGV